MTDKPKLPELLSPAGSEESLRAALLGGADAVYFGHSAFSNRMRAKNFTDDSIRDAIKLCHDCGASAHITVNTRIRDRETDDVLRLLEILLGGEPDSRADALIVADLGIARLIKDRYPHATLHASTQTSLMSPSDCKVLSELGFSRLVIPRELSLTEITRLVREADPMEIEMFIHGAHCVSLSGQCLMSYVQGGRSGNRGECAQPCRLPFSCDADSAAKDRLSLADMCLGGRITDIIGSGVASLKIEGRLKSPAYVYGVTSVYRRLLDERRNATPRDIAELESLFTRGFTDGYFTSRYGRMSSTRVSGTSETSPSTAFTLASLKQRMADRRAAASAGKPRLKAVFSLRSAHPASLTLRLGDISVTAEGDVPSPSVDRPINEATAAKNLTKMGSTPYSLNENDIEFHIDDGLWMPLSAINALRRDAVDLLISAADQPTAESSHRPSPVSSGISVPDGTELVADIADLELFGSGDLREFAESVDRICVPVHQARSAIGRFGGAGRICPSLSPFTPDDTELADQLSELRSMGVRRVLCHTIGQVRMAQSIGLYADMSYRANITSTAALEVYRDLGCASVTLSPELPGGAVKNLGKAIEDISVGCIAYGKIPVMTTARCLICGGKCQRGNAGGRAAGRKAVPHTCHTYITDRLGERFPVIGQGDCVNIIYNSTPIWMGDRLDEIKRHDGRGFFVFMFTDEGVDGAMEILKKYARGERSVGRRV